MFSYFSLTEISLVLVNKNNIMIGFSSKNAVHF